MRLPAPLVSGILVRRYKRFLAEVRLADGSLVTAHCPNSGSMMGCNVPGRKVCLSAAENPKRQTRYTWELIHLPSGWVGINTLRANWLVAEAASQGAIPEFGTFDRIVREVKLGHSRIDFCLYQGKASLFVEVKNVTLVEDGAALFPDAPTARGRKHLKVLMDAVVGGHRSVMFFVIQRGDAKGFAPAAHIDPKYAHILLQAREAGVEIIAYRARVSPEEIVLEASIPVDLDFRR